MAAKREMMGRLHESLAQMMLDELEWYQSEDTNPDRIPMPAADKGAIAKFLKDNDVTCDPMEGGQIEELRRAFEEKRAARTPTLDKLLQSSEEDINNLYQH